MPEAPLRPITSKAAIFGHPLHPALIHFPVAALWGLMATDVAYLLTQDPFWARAGLWLVGAGTVGGAISGGAGLLDILAVDRIRRLVTAWCHAIFAIMLLSMAALNWLLRSKGAEAGIWPWGIYLSFATGGLTVVTGFLGSQLVYEYAVGVDVEEAASKQPDV